MLRGTIDGKNTTHDISVDWVLNRGYARMSEVSREKNAQGAPEYEAIVFFSWDQKASEYLCLWLDTTSNAGLQPGAVIGHGKPSGNGIPFLFRSPNGDTFHTTFTYVPASNSWQWTMDGESAGKMQPFARVTLTKK